MTHPMSFLLMKWLKCGLCLRYEYKYNTNTIQVQYKYNTNTIQIQYGHIFMSTFYKIIKFYEMIKRSEEYEEYEICIN